MIERICPVAEFFVVTLLCFAALIKCVAKIIMPLALQTDIPRKQCLTKRFQRLAVIFQFISSRTCIELEFVFSARFRMCL